MDDQDRRQFLSRLRRYKKELGFILFAYVLMPNHFHLLLETPGSPLSKIMQRINQTYTQYFNKKYGKVGHVFQGRYKSFLCDREQYLLSLVRYIHLNPVRANLAARPEQFHWSSHKDYLAGIRDLVDTKLVLGLFSKEGLEARKRFRKFVDAAVDQGSDESFYRANRQQILGDDQFVGDVEKKVGKVSKPWRKPPLPEILRIVSEEMGVSPETITSRRRNKVFTMNRACFIGVSREFGYRFVVLQTILPRDLSVLSRLSRISEGGEGRKLVEKVMEKINARLQA